MTEFGTCPQLEKSTHHTIFLENHRGLRDNDYRFAGWKCISTGASKMFVRQLSVNEFH